MIERLKKQMEFIVKIDELKSILRKSLIFDGSRYENDAEHSWHLSVMALILCEHANKEVDVSKVIKLLLVHDLVEIHAGDVFVYAEKKDPEKKYKNELASAGKLFALLPDDQKDMVMDLWHEYEQGESDEAKFAIALDKLEPLMQSYYTNGKAWKGHDIKYEKVYKAKEVIKEGSQVLWEYARSLINELADKGYLERRDKSSI